LIGYEIEIRGIPKNYLKIINNLIWGFIWNNKVNLKGQGPTKVIMVHDTPPYGHAPTYQISLTYLERQTSYGPDKLRLEEAEAEAEEKIKTNTMFPFIRKGDIINRYSILYP
jgi:hypothetical protein